jgi:hypothetical protein
MAIPQCQIGRSAGALFLCGATGTLAALSELAGQIVIITGASPRRARPIEESIVAEVGADMGVFPNRWSSVFVGGDVLRQQRERRQTMQRSNDQGLSLAAYSASHPRDSFLASRVSAPRSSIWSKLLRSPESSAPGSLCTHARNPKFGLPGDLTIFQGRLSGVRRTPMAKWARCGASSSS